MREPRHPEPDSITLTEVLYALSDPARLEIVRELADGMEKPCSEFGRKSKATMSHHFKVLREAGVTHTRVDGRRRYTSLRQHDLDERFPGLLEAVGNARRLNSGGLGALSRGAVERRGHGDITHSHPRGRRIRRR